MGLPRTGTTSIGKAVRYLGFEYLNFERMVAHKQPEAFNWELLPEEAFYILTMRETPEIWFRSVIKRSKVIKDNIHIKKQREKIYGFEMPDNHKKEFIEKYKDHNTRVVMKFYPLLVFITGKMGWIELCNYLNVKVPNIDYYHINKQF